MLEQQALVTSVNGQQVEVEVAVNSSCSGCSNQESCGVGTVAKAFSGKTQKLRINTLMILQPGQWVTIATVEGDVLKIAAITYFFPLFFLFIVGLSAQSLLVEQAGWPQWIAIILAGIGGYCGHRAARHYLQVMDRQQPHIEIISVVSCPK
ncbi:SoxR reducing system RseC family protein [Psychrobium sp. 1_MG-2023]|uniref:SoxR reducing system RseC family protein n=1 Tax=Psychrobium sp. 1_MG-2023 TaxID=3062624 RepID=UPI000C34CE06|nr:SoxR reducing system RseC family protein [Psychrobium sp. 1_MG-2023]MDP2560891.1 SoxR reducing system RseC family protein [Psychrobium sp. 1_MG-2023]PKF55966.1 hypothetical protein CW748_11130 [Alteromonadales bacterium alter-6D02]